MPKEVIHDPTPIRLMDSLCQCEKHAPYLHGSTNIGGRAWVQHEVLCDEGCPSIGVGDGHPFRLVESERSEQSTPFAIEVAWGRETHLQLATINLPLQTGDDARTKELQTIREALEYLAVDPAGGLPSEEAADWKGKALDAAWVLNTMARGLYVDLNRDRTNRLIKVLKRARDQAFGADE